MSATLAEQQQALLRALWQQRHSDAMEVIAPHVHSMRLAGDSQWQRGLQAYRGNATDIAQRALAAAYPVVAQLLGEENFNALSRQAWRSHPPLRGDLAQWGGDLPALIASLDDLVREEPYLPDVARAEWALHRAATAADRQADPASFNLLATGDPGRVALVLAPGTACVASAFPIASIIGAHLHGQPSLEEAGARLRIGEHETALVWREGFMPLLRAAADGEAAFVEALLARQSLLEALDCAPAFDFDAWLAPAVQSGLLLGAQPL